jgi:uncharacterized protein (DUF2147 family)
MDHFMNNALNIKAVAALCLGLLALPASANTPSLLDEWWTPGFAARVRLTPCADDKAGLKLCGAIVWAWDDPPNGATDKRPLMGQRIIWGMLADNGQPGGALVRYAGNIYNPEDGQTYKATMRLKSANTLLVEGCVLFICREQVWRRWDSLRTPPVSEK